MPTPLVLFAGSRLDCVVPVYGTPNEVTFGINGTYSDAGVNVRLGGIKGTLLDPGSAPLMVPYAMPAGNTLYFHAYTYQSNPACYLVLFDSEGYPWFQLAPNGQMSYNSGTGSAPVWTNVGGAYGPMPGNETVDIVLALAEDGDHTVTLIYGGVTVVGPVGFTQASFTNVQSFTVESLNNGYQDVVFSQMLVTQNVTTVGAVVQTVRATGAGTHSDWSGAYTDVNEVITDDTTYNQALAASEDQSYPMGNIAVPAGFVVGGVFHWFRIKSAGTPPENVQSLIRTAAAVDHLSGNVAGVGVGFAGVGAMYPVNPDTGVAWTEADWNNPVQLGFVSET